MLFDKSAAGYERSCRAIPGGVNSNVRAIAEPFPITYSHGRDAHIWDVDGNEYIDFALGQGPMLLGHTPAPVIEAMKKQLDRGMVYAGNCEAELEAAEHIIDLVPCAEKVRFSTTGSEAVHGAIRLARAATGRKKILRFEGHYHGWLDTIAWCPPHRGDDLGPHDAPYMRPSSEGQCEEDAANLIVAPWNDEARAAEIFAEHGSEIAGVICDPYACASGIIPARKEFLGQLRNLCDAQKSVLIFDEVITGFRVALGGAQALYGVTPDVAVFAKALGGGAAVAAIAGKAAIMDEFATLRTVHAGTYNGNPLAMAATVAALGMLAADDGTLLQQAADRGTALWNGLEATAKGAGVSVDLRGTATCFSTTFLSADADPVTDFRSSLQCDAERLDRFWRALHHEGVQLTAFGIWFLSTAHSDSDIEETIAAASRVFKSMKSV